MSSLLHRQPLPKPSLAVERAMLAALEHATRHPKIWHDIGTDEPGSRAFELLAERGMIEVNHVTSQYRLKG